MPDLEVQDDTTPAVARVSLPSGGILTNTTVAQAQEQGVGDDVIVSAMRSAALGGLLALIDSYRRKLTGVEAGIPNASPERLAVWRTKAYLARSYDPAEIPDGFRVFLEREATAAGRSLAEMMALIKIKADAFDALGLMIDALQAEALAALEGVSDEAVLSGGLDVFLNQIRQNAEAEFHSAVAQLSA